MKALKIFNTIALAFPLFFALIGIIDESYFITALVSTMATGFIQVITGIIYWIENPNDHNIKIYFLLVTLFFTFLFCNIGENWVWFLPPILCIYLSLLIYRKK